MLITMNTKTNTKRAKSYEELIHGTSKPKRPMGRQKDAHKKPLNMEQFITEHDCLELYIDHPWVLDIKLYENVLMRDTLARTLTNKSRKPVDWSIELSSKVLNNTVDVQRDVFIKALCNLISIRLFSHYGTGQAFQLLVDRYSGKPRKLKYIEPKTGEPVNVEPEQIQVKH